MRINPKIIWPLGILAILLIAIYAAAPSFKKSVETALVDKIATGFSDETAQTRFMSYATMVTPLKRVELAKINQIEIFERSSQPQLFWKRLNLPEVVVRETARQQISSLAEQWLKSETKQAQISVRFADELDSIP